MVEITYFVHGTTTDNEKKQASGWNEVELSEKGIIQSKSLAETIKNIEFDIVFCSDLKRAIQSANLNFAGRNIQIVQDKRIRECNYGDFNGKDSSLVDYSKHITEPFPNGESLVQIESRIQDFIDYLQENYEGKRVAIVAHRAPQLALDVITKQTSWEEAIANDWRKTKAWQPGWEYEI